MAKPQKFHYVLTLQTSLEGETKTGTYTGTHILGPSQTESGFFKNCFENARQKLGYPEGGTYVIFWSLNPDKLSER